MSNAVWMEHVSHCYGEKKVLDNMNLEVNSGEIFGLLGPSGAGKTTIIKILTGQLAQSDGTVKVLGKDSNFLPPDTYREIGVMMDNLGLFERLSIYDNLLFFAQLQGVSKEKIKEVLQAVGLWNDRKKAVMKLSKGMKHRVSLARAILGTCKILFLDEPTSGLDPATAGEIHGLIKEQKRQRCTVFMTTHNMEEAQSLCDHVALLNKGKIVEYGSPREVCMRHKANHNLVIGLQDGSIIEVENGGKSADMVRNLMINGNIASIHSVEPTLRDVFLQLTGGI